MGDDFRFALNRFGDGVTVKIRDELNTYEGYREIIEKREAYIREDLEEIREDWSPTRLRDQYFDLLTDQISLLKAKYSSGLDPVSLVQDVESSIAMMEQCWEAESGYVQMVWILSIGIMLEMDDRCFERLSKLVAGSHLNDFLVDFLLRHRLSSYSKHSPEFAHENPYRATGEVIAAAQTDKEGAVRRLAKYLTQEWYRGHSDAGWHGSHKSRPNVHSGYWSFESGALAKILALDDSSLQDQQYYPYDMVHWKAG
ncbi:MAG: DUF1911 domain-containing protein [Deltaproteobacteria bacterium]|nr:DUF1911 domain-containing protein [Deltaproteobacteria bacterium]